MKRNTMTKQQLLLEMEELRMRLDATEQRLKGANEALQAQIAKHKRAEEALEKTQQYAQSIVETVREPLVVLTADLKVISANHSFYQTFKVSPEGVEGQFIYNVGNHQWDIPLLRKLLKEIVPKNSQFNDFKVDHEFPAIGRRTMLLNARRIYREGKGTEMILLSFEDITEQKQTEEALNISETRYRRLFETARDGILILDADTGQISDVNPFLVEMLGYSHEDVLGKKLWEIGAFKDIGASKAAFSELQNKGYVRYEDLPLETKEGRRIDVEFVSNVYLVDNKNVIQCNIRDITQRHGTEEAVRRTNQQVSAILNSISDGFFNLDNEFVVNYFNQAAEKLLGRRSENILGQKLFDAFPEARGSIFEEIYNRAMKEKQFTSIETYFETVPYQNWYEVRVYPHENGISVFFQVITERKKMEKSLTRLASFPELNPNPVMEVDLTGYVSYLNPAAKQLFPDLQTAGLHHPWLAGIESISEMFEHQKKKTHVREVKIGDIWYEQTIYYTSEGKQLRFYGLDITTRKQIEDAQMFLAQCGLPASGEDFFKSLARYLAEKLGMDYVCIDRLQEDGLAAQTVSIYFDGEFEDNLTYTLKDTPCGDVLEKTICCFPKGVRHLYPQDIVLQEMMAESYIGTILWNSKGQPIGLIAIIGRQPLANPQLAESMLKLVAVRTAGELERRETEEALQKVHDELEQRVKERTAQVRRANEQLFREMEEHKQAEEEKNRQHRRLEGLWKITRNIDADYKTLYDMVLVEIIEMTQSRYGFYGFINEDESVMTIHSWSKEAMEECKISDKPIEFSIAKAGLWGEAVRKRKILIVNDYQGVHPGKKGIPEGHVSLARILTVPVFSHERIIALATISNKPTDYTEEDAEQINAFMTHLQVILERRQAREAMQESERRLRLLSSQLLTVQETERKRVAREIHDGIGQTLAAIKFSLESKLAQMGSGAPPSGISLESIISLTQNGIEEARRIQMDLRPSILDDLGIMATLGWFCREYGKIYSIIRIHTQLQVQEHEVPDSLKTIIFRVIQESLNNTAKHSKADCVSLALQKTDSGIELRIEDNGMGFDLETTLSKKNIERGYGLSSMRERVELSGGSFSVESAQGKGTLIQASWPLQQK